MSWITNLVGFDKTDLTKLIANRKTVYVKLDYFFPFQNKPYILTHFKGSSQEVFKLVFLKNDKKSSNGFFLLLFKLKSKEISS